MYDVHASNETVAEDVKKIVQFAVEAHQNGGQQSSNATDLKATGGASPISTEGAASIEGSENGVITEEKGVEKEIERN